MTIIFSTDLWIISYDSRITTLSKHVHKAVYDKNLKKFSIDDNPINGPHHGLNGNQHARVTTILNKKHFGIAFTHAFSEAP